MTESDVIHRAIEWLVAALSVGTTSEEVTARVAPTLTERGDFVAYVNSSPRFAPWRSHRPEVEAVEIAPGGLGAVATVRTGGGRWELDAAIEAQDPHRIRRVVVRPVPDDGVEWSAILTQVAAPDRWDSALASAPAAEIHRRLVARRDESRIVGLAAAVAIGGAVLHREYLGVGDLISGQAIDDRSVFQVGSVTKVITALGVLLLAAQHRIDLDRPISDYLDAPRLEPADPDRPPPTILELLLHQAGAPRDWPPPLADALRAGVAPAAAAPTIRLRPAVGASPVYSNVGYELLGAIVSEVSGVRYPDFLESEILARLGMSSSRIQRPGALPAATVTGYQVVGGVVAPAVARPSPHPAAGGMTSTLGDLSLLAIALSEGRDPLIKTALSLIAPVGPRSRFVAGFALMDRRAGPRIWRGGGVEGFTADIEAETGTGSAVVILTTKSPPEPFDDLATEMLQIARDG